MYSYEQDDADASVSQDSEDLPEKKKIRLDTGATAGTSCRLLHTLTALLREKKKQKNSCDVISTKFFFLSKIHRRL